MTFNTGNPIGSTDARDLSDNAENFDTALGTLAPTWTDRFGVTRDSFEGRLAKGSFYRVGTFAAGYTLTNMRQTLEYNGHEYSWAGAFPKVVAAGATPETSGGIGAGLWVDRTDETLRSALASSVGMTMIGMCDSVAQLRLVEPQTTGQRVLLKQHTATTGKGGGVFKAVIDGSGMSDNNGTIIKTPLGAAWLRVNEETLNPLMFGAVGDGVTDDTSALNACFSSALSNDVDLLGLTYCITGTVYFNGSSARSFRNGEIITQSAITMTRIYSYGHTLQNISINGNNINGTTGVVIDTAAEGASIIRCKIRNTGQSAVVNNANSVTISSCTLTNCGNGSSASGNFRSTIYSNNANNCVIDSNVATQCRWGFIVRQELLPTTKTTKNKVTNNAVRGNNGLAEADSQGLSFQAQDNVQIQHNFVYDFGNNGIDMQQCTNNTVQFNRVVNCADGVFIGDRSCSGHKITHNSIENCNVGVRFYNTPSYASQYFSGITISDNYFKDCLTYSIYVSLTEPTSVNLLTSINNNNVYGSYGIYVSGLQCGSVSHNNIYKTIKHGINILNCFAVDVSKNIIRDASYGSASYDGIRIEGASNRCTITDNIIYGTAIYGVNIFSGCTNIVATGNRGRSLVTGVILDSGTGTLTTVTNSTF